MADHNTTGIALLEAIEQAAKESKNLSYGTAKTEGLERLAHAYALVTGKVSK